MSTHLAPLVSPHVSAGSLFPSQLQRSIRREQERTVGEALVARTREQARAVLANEALEAVGSLSALESHLIAIAPIGEPRYRAIVDAFTMATATSITRL